MKTSSPVLAGPKASRRFLLSLRSSITAAFIFSILITAFVLGAITFLSVSSNLRENLSQKLMDLAGVAVQSLDADEHATLKTKDDMTSPVYLKERAVLEKIRAVNPDIRFVYTFRYVDDTKLTFVLDTGTTKDDFSPLGEEYTDVTPQLVASFHPPFHPRVDGGFYTDQWGTWISGYAPLLDKNGRLEAVLGMDLSAKKVQDYENHYLLLILYCCLGVSVLGTFVGFVFSRRISRPLLLLAEDMGRIRRFEFEPPAVGRSSINEVNLMSTALENMKTGLRSFGRYIPTDVVRNLILLGKEAVPETVRGQFTFFFSDLENFTTASEGLDPVLLSEFLSDYFNAMNQALTDNGATIDKFIGDSIMAFWNAPLPLADHEAAACRAAFACQKALGGVWERWKDRGIRYMRTRMGIHTGEALVGNVGHKDRLNYTAMGDAVNVASRLEGLNKFYGTRVLVSETTFQAVRERITARLVDRVAVKGRSAGLAVYEILSNQADDPDWRELLNQWNFAFGCYLARQWKDAIAALEALLQYRLKDGPSETLLKRCQDFLKNPPPADWSGVTVMLEK